MTKLPKDFLDSMSRLLNQKEYEEFLSTYTQDHYVGLRINTLKVSQSEFLKISPFKLESIPWTKDGFYFDENVSPGRHPYYYAGLYYIQEPSAMFPASLVNARPGDKVLDLCAAPGGKTVQIAAQMNQEGIIVANDVNPKRLKALIKNVELCGVKNCIITNETPDKLATKFYNYFDKILIDAPCSGEGMFRKDKDAIKSWSKYKSNDLCVIQKDILNYADKMLKPGGNIVYSTCTFSPEEDEYVIEWFLSKFNNYRTVKIPEIHGISSGIDENSHTARLWPHKLKGEGHFAAILEKIDDRVIEYGDNVKGIKKEDLPESFINFEKENLNISIQGNFYMRRDALYYMNQEIPNLDRVNVAKLGWYLGDFEDKRFIPSHQMCIASKGSDFKNTLNFTSNSNDILKYLKGETIIRDADKGIVCVLVDGFTLGFAKQTEGLVKNLYPKAWRMMR